MNYLGNKLNGIMRRAVYGFLWLTVLAILTHCSTSEKTTLCYISESMMVMGSDTTLTTYVYEGQRIKAITLKSGLATTEYTVQYDAKGNAEKMIQKVGGITISVISYAFTDQNILVASLYGNTSTDTIRTTYVYNGSGQLTNKTESRTTGTNPARDVQITFTYPDLSTHNPATVTESDGTTDNVTSYEYDNKFNPFRGFVTPNILPYNNVTKVTTTAGTTTTTYQYNSSGYPISSVSSNGQKVTYTYNCQEI